MNNEQLSYIKKYVSIFVENKESILTQWISYTEVKEILDLHKVDIKRFKQYYASSVFNYFMSVIKEEIFLGDCPVMREFLIYLKDKEITTNELFIICSHFRKSILNFSYDAQINSKEFFDETTHMFDENFSSVLKFYNDTIYQKEQEIQKNVTLLNEYKKALDESAIVSKTNADGIITYANENFCNICGYSKKELLGSSHSLVYHPDMTDEFFYQMRQTLQGKEIFKGTMKNRRKDGSYYYLDITIVPMINPIEGEMEFISIGYEVTKLIKSRQEALEAGQAKESFLSSMSHEIRTPLNAILGFVSILLEEQSNTQHKNYLRIINNSGETLLGIINDILDFSKLRSGAFSIEKKLFNPHDEFSHVLELFSQSAYAKGISMHSFIDPKVPYELLADPLRIKQIFSNLISNAIKFTPENGEVKINVKYIDGSINIIVTDSGDGVEESEQDRIFDAFKQAKDTQGGTGLGLSISKQLAEHMGGVITYRKNSTKGSTFESIIPVEVPSRKADETFDFSLLNRLNIAIFYSNEEKDREFTYIKKYLDGFALNSFYVKNLFEQEYDLLFFIDEYISKRDMLQITNLNIPSIAIMNAPSKKYEDLIHTTTLVCPIYYEKIRHALFHALGITLQEETKYVKKRSQRRFKGYILVAEDNIANQELIKIILKRYGLSYYIASDGLEAVQTFKIASFDLVFMDAQMPRKNGLEATRDILEYEKETGMEHTPIIGLSANVIAGAKEQALSFGCDAFLGKPLIIREIEKILEQYLVEQNSLSEPILNKKFTYDRIDLNRLKEELMLEESEIELLLQTFILKMNNSIPLLSEAVEKRNFSKIALEAHSIKGSASNFRFIKLEELAKSMEMAAKKDERGYEYENILGQIKEFIEEITL